MTQTDLWFVKPSWSFGGSFILGGTASKYVVISPSLRKATMNIYFGGIGVGASLGGIPATLSYSFEDYWSMAGQVVLSQLSPPMIAPQHNPVELIFGGDGVIYEFGFSTPFNGLRAEGGSGVQLLVFGTIGASLMNIPMYVQLLIEVVASLHKKIPYNSIHAKAYTFVASTSTGIDPGSVSVYSGSWL
jgi:hypothetical protein